MCVCVPTKMTCTKSQYLKGVVILNFIDIFNPGCYSDDDRQDFIKESLKMKELHHSHVMNLIGVCLDAGPTPYIVLPFMANGDLLSYLKKHRKKLLVTTEVEDDEVSLFTLDEFLNS